MACFTTFEATELLENSDFSRFKEEESKDIVSYLCSHFWLEP